MDTNDPIDTVPLLRMLKEHQPSEMLSTMYLREHGVGQEAIAEAERRGEVVVSEDGGSFASVILTVDGDEALERHDTGGGAFRP